MKFTRLLSTIASGMVLCASALAQTYPSKPITVIVPFPPGGSSDATIRAMQAKLSTDLGQPIIVENKPGANGSIGAAYVARSAADGHTALIASVGTWAITPQLLKNVGFDPQKSFDPVTVAVRTPNIIVVPASSPVNSVAELISHLKKNPGKLSFGSAGIGSTEHLSSVLFWQKTGTEGLHVAFKGGGAAVSDLIGGHVDVMITNLGPVTGHIKSGKLKALAIMAAKRAPEFPDTMTISEAGLKGLEVYSWQGIAVPKGVPADRTARLHKAMAGALQDPAVKKSLEGMGFEVVATTPSEFAKQLTSETARWKAVIDAGNIKAE